MPLIDLNKPKSYVVEHNGLRVYIEPLDKIQDEALEQKYTTGKLEILQHNQKRGFRNGESKMILPEVRRTELNMERAKRTWQRWESTSTDPDKQMVDSEGRAIECNAQNIELMFKNHYDEYAKPILDKLESMIEPPDEDSEKN